VTKARLISLMIVAILVVAFISSFCMRPGGFNDGGFW
jgi:hypothetical protein